MPMLSPGRIQELEALYRTADDGRVRIRALIVLLAADQHRSVPEIARVVRYHDETVRRWLVRYLDGGVASLWDAPKSGAPSKVNSMVREEILRLLKQPPSDLGLPFQHWNARRLTDYLHQHSGVRISQSSIYRLMRAQNI